MNPPYPPARGLKVSLLFFSKDAFNICQQMLTYIKTKEQNQSKNMWTYNDHDWLTSRHNKTLDGLKYR